MNGTIDVPSLLEKETSDSRKAGKNLYAANYYTSPTPVPSPFLYPPKVFSAEGGKKIGGTPSKYYEVSCLDRAGEILARIRVQVREWNDYSALQNRTSPDNSGNENYYNDSQNWYPINDYSDWGNITKYPGSSF